MVWEQLHSAGHGGHGAMSAIDDVTPNAYEEAHGMV